VKQVLLLAVCAGFLSPGTAHAMANPASVFCGTMNGQTVVAKLPEGGEIGLCYLPGKKIVEEWTLFRMLDGRKPTPDNNPFR
jgi:uncharacterized protein